MNIKITNFNKGATQITRKGLVITMEGIDLILKPEDKSVGQFFLDQAEKYADKICQADATANETESYRSVRLRSIRLAIQMQKNGVKAGDVVLLCSKNSLDSVIPVLACFYLGASPASLDPGMAPKEVRHLASLVSPKMIFVDDASLSLLQENSMSVKATVLANFIDFTRPQAGEDSFKPNKVDLDSTIYIVFSSGSTGLAKAICHGHRSFLHMGYTMANVNCDFSACLHTSTFYWISAMYMLLACSINGGCRVFYSKTDDVKHFFETIEKYKVTYTLVNPLHTYQLTRFEDAAKYDTSSLNYMSLAGNCLGLQQIKRTKDLFKHSTVAMSYGLSECGYLTFLDPVKDAHFIKIKMTSCGTTAPGISLKVVDPETGKVLGISEKGEICCKSPCLMNGYLNVDRNKDFDSEGYLRTGDIGYVDEDGCWFIVDRIKEMFKYREWHIVPTFLESVLMEHVNVVEAAVFGIPHEEDGYHPAACVVLTKNAKVTEEKIEKYVELRVSDRQRLRGGVKFVKELPKTPSGKLRRRDLGQHFLKCI